MASCEIMRVSREENGTHNSYVHGGDIDVSLAMQAVAKKNKPFGRRLSGGGKFWADAHGSPTPGHLVDHSERSQKRMGVGEHGGHRACLFRRGPATALSLCNNSVVRCSWAYTMRHGRPIF